MMEAKDIDPSMFVDASVSIFGTGWAAEKDANTGLSQLRPVVLMDRPAFEQLIGVLSGFVNGSPSRASVETIWTRVLDEQLGQSGFQAEKPIAEMIQARLGIPIRMKILQKTVSEIAKLDSSELADVWKQLEFDLNRMRALYSEKNVKVQRTVSPEGVESITLQELGSRKIWWPGRGMEYAWIPAEELP